MSNTQFFTDGTADVSFDYCKAHGIEVIGLNYLINGDEYYCENNIEDPRSLLPVEFFDRMRKGDTPTTAQINHHRYFERFEPVLASGRDVFYVSFSSGLSNSTANAMMVGRELEEKYPGRRVRVIDTLNASLGEGLMAILAIRKHEEGMDDDALEAYLNDIRWKVKAWFTVDDLVYLKRGGRVSSAAAFIGGMLNIKPVLRVNQEGKLIPIDKVQGRKRALKALVDRMEQQVDLDNPGPVTLGHGDCLEDAELVVKMIKQRTGLDVDMVNQIGPIIGAHSGPGTMALFYVSKIDTREE